MNIRFLAQSEYFNGIHLKDDIILEKEFEDSKFSNIKKVHYFVYHLEDNIRKEILPRSEKLQVFNITDCQFQSDYIYFTEFDDQYDGNYNLNIIKYNYIDDTYLKIITLKDNLNLYPDKKQIKIYILNESNLIIQRAIPRGNYKDNYAGFFDFSSILFNFVDNKQYKINDENLINNGIEFMIPYNENSCIMKTGYSLFDENKHDLLEKEEAAVETVMVINIQQFISDLLLEQTHMVIPSIAQAYYDTTLVFAEVQNNYLLYSTFDFNKDEETICFYNLESKEEYTCINKTKTGSSTRANAILINGTPYVKIDKDSKSQFLNLETNEVDAVYSNKEKIVFINNNLIASVNEKKPLFGKEYEYVAIQKFPSTEVLLEEKGYFIGAIAANSDTTYIFLK